MTQGPRQSSGLLADLAPGEVVEHAVTRLAQIHIVRTAFRPVLEHLHGRSDLRAVLRRHLRGVGSRKRAMVAENLS